MIEKRLMDWAQPMLQRFKRLLCVALAAGLAACGGGSSDTQSFTVSIFAYNGGTVTPTLVQVERGQSAQFQVTPDAGFRIQAVSGCNGVLSGQNYRTGPISADCTVNVAFEPYILAPKNIQAAAGDGQITFSWDSVNGAEAYHLYYATEAGITPDNFTQLANGTRVAEVSSPYVLTGLENYTSYYATISATLGEHESPWTEQVVARPQAPFVAVGGLNDTGLDWCVGDDELVNECPAVGFPGQDGEHGRDALARAGQLPKIGGGRAGFDFTKLDANGAVLSIQHQSWNEQGNEADGTRWSCVRDNVTGLIWEVKVNNPNHLQHWEHSYSWYNPDNTTNGGDAGVQNGGVCAWTQMECDTQAYVQAINERGLCGISDWRLPDINALHSIVDSSGGPESMTLDTDYIPNIDTDYFPNTLRRKGNLGYTWSSSPYAGAFFEGYEAESETAWIVAFAPGGSGPSSKYRPYHIRLVSGSRVPETANAQITPATDDTNSTQQCRTDSAVSTPASDFMLHDDGTVTHVRTGLMWMRCTLGQVWDGETCTGEVADLSWQQALQAGATQNFAGHNDWRLPNLKELFSIIELSCVEPAINSTVFPNTPSSNVGYFPASAQSEFWTSSVVKRAGRTRGAVAAVRFYDGNIGQYGNWRGEKHRVRLVRSGGQQ